jgi:hypothetical protein
MRIIAVDKHMHARTLTINGEEQRDREFCAPANVEIFMSFVLSLFLKPNGPNGSK